MDIISTKDVDIMFSVKKRILNISAITFILVACFTAGYFAITQYLESRYDKQISKGADKSTINANTSVEEIINKDTDVNIIYRYIADNNTVYSGNDEGKAGTDLIGMNKAQLLQYCKDKGYSLIEYSNLNVSLLKEIKGWPAGRYVVKSTSNKVAIYSVNDKNELVMEEETELNMDLVPDGDREAITKGKIYETLEGAREYVDYSLNS